MHLSNALKPIQCPPIRYNMEKHQAQVVSAAERLMTEGHIAKPVM